jgi:RNA ligase (TIGR02306 family)
MENNNSVCFVAQINEIKPIKDADNIELGIIGGWNCIIKKGEYKIGDLVICATTDAVIPQDLSDKMNVTNYLRKGQRVRTVKLKGNYSECLIIPFKYTNTLTKNKLKIGDDVMDILGIFKYEPPVKNIQLASGKKVRYHENPSFVVYYKFPNIKNVPSMFNDGDLVQITCKIHGTNARYGIVKKNKLTFWDKLKKFIGIADKWIGYDYIYGSHNVEKGSDSQGFYSTDVWRTVAEKYKIREKLWNYVKENYTPENIGTGIIIYGEIFGPGIQKNYDYGLKDIEFAGFDYTVDNQYQITKLTEIFFEILLKLPHVPILNVCKWSQQEQDKWVINSFINGTKIPHEGIVIKSILGERNKIAKVINPDYTIWSEKHDVGDSH